MTDLQRTQLRRILAAFALVVVLVPLVALGGAWGVLLIPALMAAGYALGQAIKLRRSAPRSPRRAP